MRIFGFTIGRRQREEDNLFCPPESLAHVRDSIDRRLETARAAIGPAAKTLLLLGNAAVTYAGQSIIFGGGGNGRDGHGMSTLDIRVEQQRQAGAQAEEQASRGSEQRARIEQWKGHRRG